MDGSNRIIMLFGSFFIGLFLLSIFAPNFGHLQTEKSLDTSLIAQYGEMEDKIKEEQHKYYRSRAEDEEEYYKEAAPHDIDDPNYFDKSHPLQEDSLQERSLQEKPLEERPLEERPLELNPLR